MCRMVNFLVNDIFVTFGGYLFRQVIGIPVPNKLCSIAADLFLYSYESDVLDCQIKSGHKRDA